MDTPSSVTHAITLKGARITWPSWRASRPENASAFNRGGWPSIQAAVGRTIGGDGRICPGIPAEANLPHGALVGAMFVDRAVSVEHCRGSPAEAWASGPVCNVISKVVELDEPIEAKGALGRGKSTLISYRVCRPRSPVRRCVPTMHRVCRPGCTVPIPKRVRPTTDSSGGSQQQQQEEQGELVGGDRDDLGRLLRHCQGCGVFDRCRARWCDGIGGCYGCCPTATTTTRWCDGVGGCYGCCPTATTTTATTSLHGSDRRRRA